MMELTQAQKVAQGINVITKFDAGPSATLRVREVFATLQGEGPFSGLPAVFIRMSGCHLACTFCDTHWSEENDERISHADLAERAIAKWAQCMGTDHVPLFVITGGEPLVQDIEPLIVALHKHAPDAHIQIETAGSFYREIVSEEYVTVVVSPKTSFVHPMIANTAAAYKYIIRATDKFHAEFGTPLSSTQRTDDRDVIIALPPRHLPPENVFLQPCDEGDAETNAANLHKCYEIAMQHGYRVGIQLHKIMNLP